MVEFAPGEKTPDYTGLDLDRVRAIAHGQACRLTGRRRLDEDGLDLRSELVLAALERWPRFEPERGRPLAFIAIAMSNAGMSILRSQNAAKRGGETTTVSVGEFPREQVCRPLSGRRRDEVARADLELDVAEAVECLPADLAATCRGFLDAATDGRRRPSLGSAALALREHFESRGLKEYVS
ncbi:MAG TPA: sigma factor [Phycisphaerales bacterium]|nr:sigma factor [Phycisphaerales bacterium]